MQVSFTQRLAFIAASWFMGALTTGFIYGAVDLALNKPMNWTIVLVAWLILVHVSYLDLLSDYRNGLLR